MSKYNPNEFIAALGKKMNGRGIPNCPYCGGNKFTTTRNFATILIGDDTKNISLGPNIPAGIVSVRKLWPYGILCYGFSWVAKDGRSMMTMASNMNIIDTKDEGIVVKETPISISDEKLRNSLSRAYEEAQKDMSTFHFYNLYSVFLSIGKHFIFITFNVRLSRNWGYNGRSSYNWRLGNMLGSGFLGGI